MLTILKYAVKMWTCIEKSLVVLLTVRTLGSAHLSPLLHILESADHRIQTVDYHS